MVSIYPPDAPGTRAKGKGSPVGDRSRGWGWGRRGQRRPDIVSTDPDTCAEATAAWVIGALDTADRDRHEAHLDACATCQAEARDHADAIEALAATVDQVSPPPRLRRAITTHARVALTLESASHWPVARASTARLPHWATSGRLAAAVTVGSLALCVASGTYATTMQAQSTRHAAIASRLAQTLAVMYHPSATIRTLVGTDRAPGSSARLSMVPARNAAVLVAYDLPPLARDAAYQLWATLGGGAPSSAGTFDVDERGQGVLMIDLHERQLDQAFAVAVTREPVDGSPEPTGPEVLTGRL